jgi:hypothetical protein
MTSQQIQNEAVVNTSERLIIAHNPERARGIHYSSLSAGGEIGGGH